MLAWFEESSDNDTISASSSKKPRVDKQLDRAHAFPMPSKSHAQNERGSNVSAKKGSLVGNSCASEGSPNAGFPGYRADPSAAEPIIINFIPNRPEVIKPTHKAEGTAKGANGTLTEAQTIERKRAAENVHKDYVDKITRHVSALEAKLYEVNKNHMEKYKQWFSDCVTCLRDKLNVLFKAILYSHLTATELVALSAQQMNAPRFRVKRAHSHYVYEKCKSRCDYCGTK
ncbi:hypothetical protein AAVH_27520, partial [Aphelenchoides avenae]